MMDRARGTAPIWVVVLDWAMFAVVLVLALGINTHNGRNDVTCGGFLGIHDHVRVGPAGEDNLDADGDGIGCENLLD